MDLSVNKIQELLMPETPSPEKIRERAILRRLRPFPDSLKFRLLGRSEQLAAVGHRPLQPKRTQIIRPPFPEHDLEFHRQNLLQNRYVLVELLLQIDRIGRDHGLFLICQRQNGGDQIGERFSHPCSRLDHQMPLGSQRIRDRDCHFLLFRPVFEVARLREQTGLGKDRPVFFGKAGGSGMFTKPDHQSGIIIGAASRSKHTARLFFFGSDFSGQAGYSSPASALLFQDR